MVENEIFKLGFIKANLNNVVDFLVNRCRFCYEDPVVDVDDNVEDVPMDKVALFVVDMSCEPLVNEQVVKRKVVEIHFFQTVINYVGIVDY